MFVNTLWAADARAGGNIWLSSVGEGWFWKAEPWAHQNLVGTWWARELQPGKSYRMSFKVNSLQGRIVLKLADLSDITISEPGDYSYAFDITAQGKRQMMFRSASNDVRVSVTKIDVREASPPPVGGVEPEPETGSDTPAPAGNIWLNRFGQAWFYETSAVSGQLLAGTLWEAALTPANTYTMTFRVKALRGGVGLLIGDLPMIEITQTGTYSYDFPISETGARRLAFQSIGSNVAVSVSNISVAKRWTAPETGSRSGTGKGHYLSLAHARDLKTEMLDLVQNPHAARSDYHLRVAQELDAALRTPGVAGFWMGYRWRDLEIADGQYDWTMLDRNVEVARQYGIKFIVAIHDRSFDGSNFMPSYFPSEYVLPSGNGALAGFVAKRWDPYVYNRLIRLHNAIAQRYADNPGFGGIATSETATGTSSGGYTIGQYRHALTQIATQTQAALGDQGKFFFYLNFLNGGMSFDMNVDERVALVQDLPHANLVIGGPDITPDVQGMPGSVSSYRGYLHKTKPGLQQFCHAQHTDHGQGRSNVKSNKHREAFFASVERIRSNEQKPWFKGTPAVFHFDDLRDPNGNQVDLHPSWVLGDLWQLDELFEFGQRNFGCDYMIWHYREHPKHGEFGWEDTRNVILNNPYFYDHN
ncbi:MAG TPA: hypothetical protein VF210_03710 [Pseudomonadales bacterium]